ncbi:hypothetical protein UFOVP790_12 [uncultured Caudovirales phage]|uniref:Uncharacterized protein n=1 Tax=uncultured Caudovirales phage TaxID=2100421 RepID=A0A6J5P2Q3_9CAUD|nr:hypothetical protein UFOVP790_12 [uncultured Caudovirales phage]
MAHYAYIDDNNIVTDVIVGKDENELIDGLDPETYYGAIRTSYNGNIRYNFAGIGYTYDPIDDAFIAPMPLCGHDSLLLNDLKRWECAECEAIANETNPF